MITFPAILCTLHILYGQGSDEAQASRPPKKKFFFPVTSAELFFFFSLGKIFGYLAKFGKKIWILLTSLLDRLWWFFLDFFFWIFFSEIARSQKKIFFFFLVKNFVMSKKKNFFWEAGRPGPHQSLGMGQRLVEKIENSQKKNFFFEKISTPDLGFWAPKNAKKNAKIGCFDHLWLHKTHFCVQAYANTVVIQGDF